MIRRKEDCTIELRDSVPAGSGQIVLQHLIKGPEELCGKGRLFAAITIKPGCSIGYHKHEGDGELYYIVKGTGEYNDNGELRTVRAGDVTICPPGQSHGMANRTQENIEMVAVILYK